MSFDFSGRIENAVCALNKWKETEGIKGKFSEEAISMTAQIMELVVKDQDLIDLFRLNQRDGYDKIEFDVAVYNSSIQSKLIDKILDITEFAGLTSPEKTAVKELLNGNINAKKLLKHNKTLKDRVALINYLLDVMIPSTIRGKMMHTYCLSDDQLAVPMDARTQQRIQKVDYGDYYQKITVTFFAHLKKA